jgi:hypothetical protein
MSGPGNQGLGETEFSSEGMSPPKKKAPVTIASTPLCWLWDAYIENIYGGLENEED